MHARSTTFHADRGSIDAGIAQVRDEVLPAVMGISGCLGLSMLVDRESGRCIVTTSWETEDAMRASAEAVRPLRATASQTLGGETEVQEWEIAHMHRDHAAGAGAWVAATWLKGDPANLDRAIELYTRASLPAIERLNGFCSASLMVDRATGLAVVSATYDSKQALEATRERAASVRAEGSQGTGADIVDIATFELAIAHLRVPELA